jgi:major type 1 subunit fimbrin (pilin)
MVINCLFFPKINLPYVKHYMKNLIRIFFVGLYMLLIQNVSAVTTSCTITAPPAFTLTSGTNPYSYTGSAVPNSTVLMYGNLTATLSCNGPTDYSNYGGIGVELTGITNSLLPSGVSGIYVEQPSSIQPITTSGCATFIGAIYGTNSIVIPFYNPNATACSFSVTIPLMFSASGNVGIGNGNLLNIPGLSFFVLDNQYADGSLGTGKQFTGTSSSLPSYNFSGIKTCTVSPSSQSILVNLPSVSKQQLNTAGQTAGKTMFSITMTGCTYPSSNTSNYVATATWQFTAGNSSSLIANTASSPAANVQIQLLDANGNAISTGGTVATTINAAAQLPTYTQYYYAQYYAYGAAGAGAVTGVATYSMTYQ